MTNNKILQTINLHLSAIKLHSESIRKALEGKRYKIISDFNGQPYGHSKPSLKGKVFVVRGVVVDEYEDVSVWNGNIDHCFINLDEVEFIEEPPCLEK